MVGRRYLSKDFSLLAYKEQRICFGVGSGWPTVQAGPGRPNGSATRVMARYDTVTNTLHGRTTEVARHSVYVYQGITPPPSPGRPEEVEAEQEEAHGGGGWSVGQELEA